MKKRKQPDVSEKKATRMTAIDIQGNDVESLKKTIDDLTGSIKRIEQALSEIMALGSERARSADVGKTFLNKYFKQAGCFGNE